MAVAFGVAVLLIAGGVTLLLTRGDDDAGTAIPLRFEQQQNLRYGVRIHDEGSTGADGNDYAIDTTTTVHFTVESVDGDGTATTSAVVGEITSKPAGGEPSTLGPLTGQTIRVESDGHQLDSLILLADPEGTLMGLSDLIFPFLPPPGAEPGDTWEIDAAQGFPLGSGTTTFVGTGTLVRFEGGDTPAVAVVEADLTESWDDVTVDSATLSVMGGGEGGGPGTVSWNGSQRLHVRSRVDTVKGIVLDTTASADYDLVVGSSVADPDGASSLNTGSFTQESKLLRS